MGVCGWHFPGKVRMHPALGAAERKGPQQVGLSGVHSSACRLDLHQPGLPSTLLPVLSPKALSTSAFPEPLLLGMFVVFTQFSKKVWMGFNSSSFIHLLLLTYLLSPYYVQSAVLVMEGFKDCLCPHKVYSLMEIPILSCSFSKYLLKAYYVPGAVLGVVAKSMTRIGQVFALMALTRAANS